MRVRRHARAVRVLYAVFRLLTRRSQFGKWLSDVRQEPHDGHAVDSGLVKTAGDKRTSCTYRLTTASCAFTAFTAAFRLARKRRLPKSSLRAIPFSEPTVTADQSGNASFCRADIMTNRLAPGERAQQSRRAKHGGFKRRHYTHGGVLMPAGDARPESLARSICHTR